MLLVAIPATHRLSIAQETRGSIRGTVQDTSGALVPGATVTIVNTRTGVTATVTTSPGGDFALPNLSPGAYTVIVEKNGFKKSVNENVEVLVATPSVVDIQLGVGAVTQSVTVAAQTVPITETSGDRGTDISPTTLADLPTELSDDNRRIESFVFLTPGVTGDTFSTRINGAPTNSSELLMDGLPFLDGCCNGEFEQYEPPYESVDEFKMQNNTYSAEYGRGVGVENFHFRSGTNQFHGDVYDFLRNNVLDSRGFYSPTVGINKQNEYGVTAGGPVYIPKVYDGRNKTFWEFTGTWFKFRGAIRTSLTSVPPMTFTEGDFRNDLDSAGNLIPIFDPATTRPDGAGGLTRDQFQCGGTLNVICSNRISTISKAFIPLMPTATLPGIFNNLLAGVPSAPTNNHYDLIKIDHNIGSKTSLHASYYRSYADATSPPAIPGPLGVTTDEIFPGNSARFGLDRSLTPNIQNTFGATFSRPSGSNYLLPSAQTAINNAIAPQGFSFPALGIPGFVGFGSGSINLISAIPGFGLRENVNWAHGRNLMNIGLELRWEDQNVIPNINFPGIYGFSTATTSLPDSPSFASWGNGFASFLLGAPTSLTKAVPIGDRNLRTAYRALYFQDDFRLSKKLTLNLGARYDIPEAITEKYNRISTLDPNVPNPGAGGLPGALVFAGTQGGPCLAQGGASLCRSYIANHDYREVQPRLGFAYRLNDMTVVRGGFGITFIAGGNVKIFGPNINSYYLTGFQSQETLISPDGGISPIPGIDLTNLTTIGWDQGITPVPLPQRTLTAANGQGIDYWDPTGGRQSYMELWSFTVERKLPGQIALETSYVGNKGTRLAANEENLDQVNPSWLSLGNELTDNVTCLADASCPNAIAAGVKIPYTGFTGSINQALRPFPQYANINSNTQETGNSTYESLQVRAQKFFSHGVSFLAAYTASKTLSNTTFQFASFNSGPIDTYSRKRDKAELPDGYPQILSLSTVYELPIGPQQKFANVGGPVGKLLGGWEVGYIGSYYSGPFLPISGGPSLPLFNDGNRPNVVSGMPQLAPRTGKFDPNVDLWLNAAAFAQPGPLQFGDAPRVLNARDPAFYNENLSILKRTRIRESINVEFRAEFFNLFNRTIFGNSGTNVLFGPGLDTNFNDTTGFGKIGSQANQPRQIQFGLKFNW
jgi:hypothetical protein